MRNWFCYFSSTPDAEGKYAFSRDWQRLSGQWAFSPRDVFQNESGTAAAQCFLTVTTLFHEEPFQPAGRSLARIRVAFSSALGSNEFLFMGWNHLCCELAQRGNAWQFLTIERLGLR